jgi:hypothetical protein
MNEKKKKVEVIIREVIIKIFKGSSFSFDDSASLLSKKLKKPKLKEEV